MELYKFCERRHVPTREGCDSVRVGTLYDYRKTDKYGELVSDKYEGSKNIAGTALNLTNKSIHLYPGLKSIIDIQADGAFIGHLEICESTIACQDFYVFSAAKNYTPAEHRKWFEKEKYDACYKIISARLFFREISRALGSRAKFLGFADVQYAECFDISAPDWHPAIVKRQPAHSGQQEVRAVWWPSSDSIEPVILERTNLWLYCSLHQELGDI